MPIYEYRCHDCRRRVSIWWRTFSEAETNTAQCPRCSSQKLTRLVSKVRVIRSEESRLEDLADPPPKGHLITIPTEGDLAERRKSGRAARQYNPDPRDVPAARYIFAQLCADQVNGSRSDVYPEPLEKTGLEWPDKIEE